MIILNNVCAGYDNNKVLRNISFKIRDGENLAIIGPNGCGKTTLLRAIANIIPFRGEILLNQTPIKNMNKKEMAKQVAMLSQITNIYFNYTIYDTVMMGRYVHCSNSFFSKPSEKDRAVVDDTLKIVGLFDIRDREVDTLSGGQLQRVFLAKIIAQQPNVILLDEPTNHLDLSYQIELINFLKGWSKEANRTVVGVLHDINLAMLLTDNILLLNNGEIEAFGSCTEILTSSLLKKVYNMDITGFMKNAFKKWEEVF